MIESQNWLRAFVFHDKYFKTLPSTSNLVASNGKPLLANGGNFKACGKYHHVCRPPLVPMAECVVARGGSV